MIENPYNSSVVLLISFIFLLLAIIFEIIQTYRINKLNFNNFWIKVTIGIFILSPIISLSVNLILQNTENAMCLILSIVLAPIGLSLFWLNIVNNYAQKKSLYYLRKIAFLPLIFILLIIINDIGMMFVILGILNIIIGALVYWSEPFT